MEGWAISKVQCCQECLEMHNKCTLLRFRSSDEKIQQPLADPILDELLPHNLQPTEVIIDNDEELKRSNEPRIEKLTIRIIDDYNTLFGDLNEPGKENLSRQMAGTTSPSSDAPVLALPASTSPSSC